MAFADPGNSRAYLSDLPVDPVPPAHRAAAIGLPVRDILHRSHISLVKKEFSVYYPSLNKLLARRRSQVAKAVVCKTIIQRFKSARRLHSLSG
jgi:hypothetical protein